MGVIMRTRTLLASILLYSVIGTSAMLVGCASVSIRKVPTPTQYIYWSDEMQREADKMEGLRFYLPRPFINVFESFPVRTDIFFAHGLVSADGKYVRLLKISKDSAFHDYIAASEEIKIPGEYLIDIQDLERYRTEGLGVAKDAAEAIAGAPQTEPPTEELAGAGRQGEPVDVAPQPPSRTGRTEQSVTNDNMAFAYQPLRGNFDIVYLPDFEEQYVVSGVANLGNVQFSVNLGQGWSLQGFNALVDNRALNERIFDLIDTSISAAKAGASGLLGVPLPGVLDLPSGTTFRTEGDTGERVARVPGSYVTMKIVVVHYASRGIYPVIKPRELQERAKTLTRQASFFANLWEPVPRMIGASELDPNTVTDAQKSATDESRTFTVPRYPYQYVSFNTFRYAAIELLKTENTPFGELYDRTGTKGDPGDARQGELSEAFRILNENFGSRDSGGDEKSATTDATALDALLKTIIPRDGRPPKVAVPGLDGPYFVIASAKLSAADPNVLEVTLKAGPTGAPAEDPGTFDGALLTQINKVVDRQQLRIGPFTKIKIVPGAT